MRCYGKPYRLASVAFLGALGTIALASCRESPLRPETRDDEWAERVAVNVSVSSELQFYKNGGTMTGGPLLQQSIRPELRYPIPSQLRSAGSVGREGNRVRLRHLRGKAGRLFTLAVVSDEEAKPPKRVYGFENGQIRFIYSVEYQRRGSYWRQTRSRIVGFGEDGKPTSRIDTKVSATALATQAASPVALRFATDALTGFGRLLLPAELHAEGMDDGGTCMREFMDVMSKWFTYTGAVALAVIAAEKCAINPLLCVAAYVAGAAAFAAFVAWTNSLDALTKCDLASFARSTNGSRSPSASEDRPEEHSSEAPAGSLQRIDQIVDQFVSAAETNGTFWCNEDATECIYYAN